jgi:hypothetical protein
VYVETPGKWNGSKLTILFIVQIMFGLDTSNLIEFSFKAVTNSMPAGSTGNV